MFIGLCLIEIGRERGGGGRIHLSKLMKHEGC